MSPVRWLPLLVLIGNYVTIFACYIAVRYQGKDSWLPFISGTGDWPPEQYWFSYGLTVTGMILGLCALVKWKHNDLEIERACASFNTTALRQDGPVMQSIYSIASDQRFRRMRMLNTAGLVTAELFNVAIGLTANHPYVDTHEVHLTFAFATMAAGTSHLLVMTILFHKIRSVSPNFTSTSTLRFRTVLAVSAVVSALLLLGFWIPHYPKPAAGFEWIFNACIVCYFASYHGEFQKLSLKLIDAAPQYSALISTSFNDGDAAL